MHGFDRWAAEMMDILFPPRCPGCGVKLSCSRDGLCEKCLSKIKSIASPLCLCCGMPFVTGVDHLCENCMRKRMPFDLARSAVVFVDPVRLLIHQLKYRFDTTVSAALLCAVRDFDFSLYDDCDLWGPVPLHGRRIQQRGINQSLWLTRLLFPEKKDKLVPDLLTRVRHTLPQAGLGGDARRQNLAGAFAVTRGKNVHNRRICLVDDVFTTGTTVAECARVLKKEGASSVKVFTLARVHKES